MGIDQSIFQIQNNHAASQRPPPDFHAMIELRIKPSCNPLLFTGRYCGVQVYELRSPHFLLSEWMMERSKVGCWAADTCGSVGGSSLVVMSKGSGMHYIKQAYMVRIRATSPA